MRVPDLDDDLRADLMNDLLIHPGVQDVLPGGKPHPADLVEKDPGVVPDQPATQAAIPSPAIILAHGLQPRGELLEKQPGILGQQLTVACKPRFPFRRC
jgi:hypothetical protein